jgi:putative resolvase
MTQDNSIFPVNSDDDQTEAQASTDDSAAVEETPATDGTDDALSEAGTELVPVDKPRSPARRKKATVVDPNAPIKLRAFAEKHSISYGTAHKHWTQGRIRGKQLTTGTILVWDYYDAETRGGEPENTVPSNAAVLYARVPTSRDMDEAREAARLQLEELETYAENSGYDVVYRAGDIAMALAPNRNNLLEILNRKDWRVLVVYSRDIPMLTGLPYLEAALSAAGKRIEYLDASVGYAENDVLDFAKQTKHLLGTLIGGVRKHDVRLGLERLVR